MENLPFWQKAFYRYLGIAYLFTYRTSHHAFLGATGQQWLQGLAAALLLAALLLRWGQTAVAGAAFLWLWLYFSYWRAKKNSYSKFVAGHVEIETDPSLAPLPPYERIPLWATGIYNVVDLEKFLLLHPAEYWQTPLGQHVVMVAHRRGKYLYQFFGQRNLRRVESGWLVFGLRPLPTIAVTFISTWAEAAAENSPIKRSPPKPMKIFLSFPDEKGLTAVWHASNRSLPPRDLAGIHPIPYNTPL